MKKSKTYNLRAIWDSGRVSMWKVSLVLATLLIISPLLTLIGYQFTLEGRLTNPERTLNVYINNGVFTFVNTLSDGTTRKSSGLVGFTQNTLYFLILESRYLHVADYLTPSLKRDLINANNRLFDVRLEAKGERNVLISFDEELNFEGVQSQLAKINGRYPEIKWLFPNLRAFEIRNSIMSPSTAKKVIQISKAPTCGAFLHITLTTNYWLFVYDSYFVLGAYNFFLATGKSLLLTTRQRLLLGGNIRLFKHNKRTSV